MDRLKDPIIKNPISKDQIVIDKVIANESPIQIKSNDSDISTLQTQVANIINNVAALSINRATDKNDLDFVKSKVTVANVAIRILQVNQTTDGDNIRNLQNELNNIELDISLLQRSLDKVSNSINNPNAATVMTINLLGPSASSLYTTNSTASYSISFIDNIPNNTSKRITIVNSSFYYATRYRYGLGAYTLLPISELNISTGKNTAVQEIVLYNKNGNTLCYSTVSYINM